MAEPGQLIDVVHHQTVANVEDGVAAIQPRLGLVGGKAIARSLTIGAGGAVVPARAAINGVAEGISQIHGHTVPRLRAQGSLQTVVIGVDAVLPLPQTSVVRIQTSAGVSLQSVKNGTRQYLGSRIDL